MADEKKIVIEIVTQTVAGSSGGGAHRPNWGDSDKKTLPGSNDEKNKNFFDFGGENSAKAAKAALIAMVADTAVNVGKMSVNRYFSLTENYIAETTASNLSTTASKLKSLGGSVAIGFATGNIGGAIVGAISWGVKEYTNYQQRMSGYYQQINATNYQTEFDRSRMGLTNEGKGTEN